MRFQGLHILYAKVARLLGVTEQRTSSLDDGRSPAPRVLIENRVNCELQYLDRTVDADADSPLAALYRMYEHLVLDQHLNLRNEIEAFWYHKTWAIANIPDPCDPDRERYACLSCIPALLCLAFNARIDLGLPREAPSIITGDMMDHWKTQEKRYEKEPLWTGRVPRLSNTLAIPHWDNSKRDFVPLENLDDPRASKEFTTKNILIWNPHVHFI